MYRVPDPSVFEGRESGDPSAPRSPHFPGVHVVSIAAQSIPESFLPVIYYDEWMDPNQTFGNDGFFQKNLMAAPGYRVRVSVVRSDSRGIGADSLPQTYPVPHSASSIFEYSPEAYSANWNLTPSRRG